MSATTNTIKLVQTSFTFWADEFEDHPTTIREAKAVLAQVSRRYGLRAQARAARVETNYEEYEIRFLVTHPVTGEEITAYNETHLRCLATAFRGVA